MRCKGMGLAVRRTASASSRPHRIPKRTDTRTGTGRLVGLLTSTRVSSSAVQDDLLRALAWLRLLCVNWVDLTVSVHVIPTRISVRAPVCCVAPKTNRLASMEFRALGSWTQCEDQNARGWILYRVSSSEPRVRRKEPFARLSETLVWRSAPGLWPARVR